MRNLPTPTRTIFLVICLAGCAGFLFGLLTQNMTVMVAGVCAWVACIVAIVTASAAAVRKTGGVAAGSAPVPTEEMKNKNNTHYILGKLKECKTPEEEIDVINTWLDGPKFRVMFAGSDDAIRFSNRIPYRDREGTITFGRPVSDGVYIFTGGKISQDEALAVFEAIRAPGSNQMGTVFYDWKPPQAK